MFRFFETIRIRNGEVYNLEYHLQRMLRTAIDFRINNQIVLSAVETLSSKAFEKHDNLRCKLLYDKNGFKLEFEAYNMRIVKSLKLVIDDSIDYSFKYSNRSAIDLLFSKRHDCDDILIVKNGKLSDTSIANILLYDGKIWVTPDMPLLNGTCRQRLIDEGRVEVKEVFFKDLKTYFSIMLVNALRDFDEEGALSINTSVKL